MRDAFGNMVSAYENTTLTEVPLYGSGRIGLFKPSYGNLYELNDHLGNVRAVIGKPETRSYRATMEDENLQHDEFEKYSNTRMSTIAAINHTPIYETGEFPEVVRLNGKYNINEGPGKSLQVMPGDVVKIEVFARYLDLRQDEGIGGNALLSAIAGLLTGFTITPIDGGFKITDTNTNLSAIIDGLTSDDNVPAVWLNCYFFGNDKSLLEAKFMGKRVSSEAAITPLNVAGSHEKLSLEVKIEKPGYLYINVSHDANENIDVYFDDLTIEHTYSPVVAGSDYYPFGLAIEDRQITREDYRFGYQGQYAEKDEETGWNHFELREYDPIIGRWTTKDPKNQFFSPYMGMGNNPAIGTDPDGGKNVKFDASGNYIGIDHDVWWHNLLFGSRGAIVDANGDFASTFKFADPAHDVADLESGAINRLVLVQESEVVKMLGDAGAFPDLSVLVRQAEFG